MPRETKPTARVLPDLQAEAKAAERAAAAAAAVKPAPLQRRAPQRRYEVAPLPVSSNVDLPPFDEFEIPGYPGFTMQSTGEMIYLGLPIKPAEERELTDNNNVTYGGTRTKPFAIPGRPDLGLWLVGNSVTSWRNVKQPVAPQQSTSGGRSGNALADMAELIQSQNPGMGMEDAVVAAARALTPVKKTG